MLLVSTPLVARLVLEFLLLPRDSMDQVPTGPLYYSLLQRVLHGPVWLSRMLRRGYKNTNVHRVLRTYRKGPRSPQAIHGIRRATLATALLKATERREECEGIKLGSPGMDILMPAGPALGKPSQVPRTVGTHTHLPQKQPADSCLL